MDVFEEPICRKLINHLISNYDLLKKIKQGNRIELNGGDGGGVANFERDVETSNLVDKE